ncbi:MAG: hypothetical protein KF767_17545 [Bdellovibrionaceae bacterium]|nr:hypothetical protein [Pseudobdellovibrionaceae bacterium]
MMNKLILTLAGWLMATNAQAQIQIFSPAPTHVRCAAVADGHRGPDFDLEIKRTGDPEPEFWRSSKTPVEVTFAGFANDAVIATSWSTTYMSTRCAEELRHFVDLPGIGSLRAFDIFNDGCGFRGSDPLTLHVDSPTGTSPRRYLLKCEEISDSAEPLN